MYGGILVHLLHNRYLNIQGIIHRTESGELYVTGYDLYGQIGLGYSANYLYLPQALPKENFGGEDAVGISAGESHTLVVTSKKYQDII
jgi:hypothetical protein